MSGTLVVPEIAGVQSFEWDKLVLDYLFATWTQTDPAKGSALIDPLDKEKLRFRVGFPDTNQSYEITALETDTIPTDFTNAMRRFGLQTTVDLTLRMKRLDRDKPNLQLLKMELEVMRIAMDYVNQSPQPILGIKELRWMGKSRQYNPADTWAKSDWRSIVRLNLIWEIQIG